MGAQDRADLMRAEIFNSLGSLDRRYITEISISRIRPTSPLGLPTSLRAGKKDCGSALLAQGRELRISRS